MESREIITALKQPEKTAEIADLIYVNDKNFKIIRKPYGRGFTYLLNDERIRSEAILKRIKSLVIPPSWDNVKISEAENGHLQAVGRDDKHRKVYRYHPLWVKLRNQTKFLKMVSFGQSLPKIRAQVETDLSQQGMPKTKVLALVIRLMEETHIRVGNENYAKRNQTYGLSTLRSKHVDIYDHKIEFHFTGKSGKEHSITVENEKLINLINQCEEIPGWELFKYYDDNGKHNVDSGMVNDYIHILSGNEFSAKDFRTWAASKIYFEVLSELPPPKTDKEKEQYNLKAIDKAANSLGNTRAVCREYYIHPLLFQTYHQDSMAAVIKKSKSFKDQPHFTSSEQALLELFSNYDIKTN
ncbi:DNA topoisomerase IB [Psychroflexus tropicus]|uniref:DNA topoisomerase IB n=1 Tax=Psychroflexus tropicus TaxID=197345 RepID=UPI0003732816|nr:DNA topoisomerase IB [Psychroflexus tropicus]